jgi:competence protein ComEA
MPDGPLLHSCHSLRYPTWFPYYSPSYCPTLQGCATLPSANGQPVDLNSASKKDLAALPGIGPRYAQSIIDARPFASKEDLLKKRLIPQETYDKFRAA